MKYFWKVLVILALREGVRCNWKVWIMRYDFLGLISGYLMYIEDFDRVWMICNNPLLYNQLISDVTQHRLKGPVNKQTNKHKKAICQRWVNGVEFEMVPLDFICPKWWPNRKFYWIKGSRDVYEEWCCFKANQRSFSCMSVWSESFNHLGKFEGLTLIMLRVNESSQAGLASL